MKRIILLALLALVPASLYAQLEADTATTSTVHLTLAADGTEITGITATNLTLHWYKNGVFSETEVCAASGTDHDCVDTGAADGNVVIEISADKVSDGGELCVVVDYTTTQAVSYEKCWWVLEDSSMAAVVQGNNLVAADVNAELDAALSDIGADNQFSLVDGVADSGTTTTLVDAALTQPTNDWFKGQTLLFTDGTLALQTSCITGFTASSDTLTFFPAVTTAVATHEYQILAQRCNPELFTVQGDTAFPWFFGPFRSTTNGITKATASDGAPTCTRSINGGAWTAADNAEGTIDAEGWSSLTLSATETGATSTLRVSCALTGFIDQDAIFHIQR